MMNRRLSLGLGVILAVFTLTSLSWAVPMRRKTQAQINAETMLTIKGIITSNKVQTDAGIRTKTRVVTVKIISVSARQAVNKAALKPGNRIVFQKTCQMGAKGKNTNRCGSKWAKIPSAFQQKKGSKLTVGLRILRSGGRVVFATISNTFPETGVIKGAARL